MKADFKIKIGGEAPSMKKGNTFLVDKKYTGKTIFTSTFEVPEGSKVYVNGQEQVSGKTEQDFLNSLTYKLVSEKGKETTYKVVVNYISNDFKVTPKGVILGTNKLLPTAIIGEYMNGVRVTKIATGGFQNYKYLRKLRLPNSLETIGSFAFENCENLSGNLNISSLVEYIGAYAFANCSGLTGDLTIPSSVTFIGDATFYGCSGFTGHLTIPSSITFIGDATFNRCSGFTGDLNIPSSVKYIGDYAFAHCSRFTGDLSIPNSVIHLGDNAFKSTQIIINCNNERKN